MNQIEIYKSVDNEIELKVNLDNENDWLTQKQMWVLFDRDCKTISKHIINTFKEGELTKNSVVANFATTAKEFIKQMHYSFQSNNFQFYM